MSNLVFYPAEKMPRSPPGPRPTLLRPRNGSRFSPPRPSFLKQPNLPSPLVLGHVSGAEGCNAQGSGSPALPPCPFSAPHQALRSGCPWLPGVTSLPLNHDVGPLGPKSGPTCCCSRDTSPPPPGHPSWATSPTINTSHV